MPSRGKRNNNPGNIRKGNDWQNERAIQTDAAFEEFETMPDGVRALGKLIQNYQRLYGINTIRGIVERFAPNNENPTDSYVFFVSARMGISPDAPLDLTVTGHLPALVAAISRFEMGEELALADLSAGMELLA